MSAINEKEIMLIKDFLLDKVKPYVVYLFGSAAKGNMREDSDIDLGFISDEKLDAYEVFMIAQELADLLGREVDLVDLNQASTVFQLQVISKGKVIHSADETRRKLFELLVLKKYTRLNEERQVILEKIKERGSIYG